MPNRIRESIPQLVFCWLVCVISNASSAQDSKSETVFVSSKQAQIRSGPSKDDYPTSLVERGTPLKSFHETEDGWLAIQPPPGSFSWVPATSGYLLPGGKSLEITAEESVSWIGTKLGIAKQYRWQVELNPGEQLVVVGEASRQSSNGQSSLWYRVAPPNGEFRWIHRSDTSKEPVDAAEPERIASTEAKPLENEATSAVATTQERSDTPENSILENQNTQSSNAVQQAAYQEDIFSAGDQALRPIPNQSPSRRITPARQGNKASPWNGWHAWELTDDGMRFTLFDRMRGGRTAKDPLKSDPFDISMATKHVQRPPANAMARAPRSNTQRLASPQPRVDNSVNRRPPSSNGTTQNIVRKDRPWRDPRTLGKNSLQDDYYSSDYASRDSDRYGSLGSSDYARRDEFDANQEQRASDPNPVSRPGAEQLIAQIRDGVGALGSSLRSGLNLPSAQKPTDSRASNEFENEVPSFQAVDWYGVSSDKNNITPASAQQRPSSSTMDQSPAFTEIELNRLQADLTAMVAAPASSWDLKDIKQRTEYLIKYGSTPVSRGRARLLLERIEEFEQHASKTAFTTFGRVTSATYSSAPATFASGGTNPPVTTAQFGARPDDLPQSSALLRGGRQYDATGWLVPVYGATTSLPEYALTNQAGQTVAYVTTLPGMNLSIYLNKPVGIIGLRGYLPQLQAGYIQAERVFVIKK